MRLARHELGGEAADGAKLLALLEMRGCLESGTAAEPRRAVAMIARSPVILADLATQLHELIVAIDRRLPHAQRAGEAAIANAAVRLRLEAVKRLNEIEKEIAGRKS